MPWKYVFLFASMFSYFSTPTIHYRNYPQVRASRREFLFSKFSGVIRANPGVQIQYHPKERVTEENLQIRDFHTKAVFHSPTAVPGERLLGGGAWWKQQGQ
jgi:hypothetical protein